MYENAFGCHRNSVMLLAFITCGARCQMSWNAASHTHTKPPEKQWLCSLWLFPQTLKSLGKGQNWSVPTPKVNSTKQPILNTSWNEAWWLERLRQDDPRPAKATMGDPISCSYWPAYFFLIRENFCRGRDYESYAHNTLIALQLSKYFCI